MHFQDRIDAAKQLIPKLSRFKDAQDTVILAIPRGSLQMGYELSRELHLPLDIVVTKKVPHPHNEEYAIGSIAPDGEVMLNEAEAGAVPPGYIEETREKLLKKVRERYRKYRGKEEIPSFSGKTVIILDDGIATGFTMKAAVAYLKRQGVANTIVAVPVAAADSAAEVKAMVDEFICLDIPDLFGAVGQFYWDFPQVTDEEAAEFLQKAAESHKNEQKS